MNGNGLALLYVVVFAAGLALLQLLIIVALIRWALRINHLCKRLDEIAAVVEPQPAPTPTEAKPGAAKRWLKSGGMTSAD